MLFKEPGVVLLLMSVVMALCAKINMLATVCCGKVIYHFS